MFGRRSGVLYGVLALVYALVALDLVYVLARGDGNALSVVFVAVFGVGAFVCFRSARQASARSGQRPST